MWTFILEKFFVNLDIDTTVENSNFYIRKICAEPLKFMANLDKFRKQTKQTVQIYYIQIQWSKLIIDYIILKQTYLIS